MSARRPFVRPMAGWWRRNPYFVRYMAREATALFVVVYALILLVTVARLAEGRASYEKWLEFLRSDFSIGLHAALLLAFLYHTKTWFDIMPKTLPPIAVGGRKLTPAVITTSGLVASAALSAALFILVKVIS